MHVWPNIVVFYISGSLNLFSLGVGIAEAAYLVKYDQYKNVCDGVWVWLAVACVIDICVPIFTCFGLKSVITSKDEQDKSIIDKLLYLGNLVVAIWSAVTYFNISSNCYDFWNSNAPELWAFIVIHYVLFWIYVTGFIIIGITLAVFIHYRNEVARLEEETRIYGPSLYGPPKFLCCFKLV